MSKGSAISVTAHMDRRQFLKLLGGAVGAAALGAFTRHSLAGALARAATPAGDEPGPPPNIVHIMTDDQDRQSWWEQYTLLDKRKTPVLGEDGEPVCQYAMPYLRSNPYGGWVSFATAVSPASICAPARAGMLTGVTPARHGVLGNGQVAKLDGTNTLAAWLAESGYRNYYTGKYSFGKPNASFPKPDGWTKFDRRGGRSSAAFRKGTEFIREAAQSPGPWSVWIWTTDPHRSAVPSSRHKKENILPAPLPPSLNEEDVSDKPEWVRSVKPLPTRTLKAFEQERVRHWQTVRDVDDGIRSVMETLVEVGALDNTIVVFTSDNGYSWGQHRLLHKNLPYDASALVPLAIRVPWLAESHVEPRVVSHLDVTATLVAAAGATPRRELVGHSLLPVIEDPTIEWDNAAYVTNSKEVKQGNKSRPEFHGVRTDGYLYVEYPATGERELYDLAADPHQMESVHGREEYAEAQQALAERLAAIRAL